MESVSCEIGYRKVYMNMIRLVLVALYLVLFLLLTLPIIFAEWILNIFRPDLTAKSSRAIVAWGFRCILFVSGVKLTVLGKENIPDDRAVVYVGNHRSMFDTVLTYPCFPNPTGIVAKKETLKVPILRLWMMHIGCIFLDRQNIKEGLKSILAGIEQIKSGRSICIFPEGTRSRVPDEFLPFHEGSFKLASKSGAPVIPMTIVNSAAIFEDHFPWIKKSRVILEFGQPILISELPKETQRAVGSYVSGIIQKRYFELKKEYFPGDSAVNA